MVFILCFYNLLQISEFKKLLICCGSCFHSISRSPKLPLVFVKLYTNTVHVFYFLNIYILKVWRVDILEAVFTFGLLLSFPTDTNTFAPVPAWECLPQTQSQQDLHNYLQCLWLYVNFTNSAHSACHRLKTITICSTYGYMESQTRLCRQYPWVFSPTVYLFYNVLGSAKLRVSANH